MILTGSEITKELQQGRIVIDPFDLECVNPNSYNFRLSNILRVYDDEVLDTRRPNPSSTIEIPESGYLLRRGQFYLGASMERMGSTHFAPTYAARSSVARLGMFINLSSPLGDIGFVGCWTLQLYPVNTIRVYPRMKIGQIMFWKPKGKIDLYDGKYQSSDGPRASEIHKDRLRLLKAEAS